MPIQPIQLQPIEFKPYQFKPQDINLERPNIAYLDSALREYGEKRDRAVETNSKFNESMDKLAERLSPDAQTQRWFQNNITEKKLKLNALIQNGEYSKATELAADWGSGFANEEEFKAREYAYKNWTKAMDEVDKLNIDPAAKKIFKEFNQFDPETSLLRTDDNRVFAKEFQYNNEFNRYSGGAPTDIVDWDKDCEIIGKLVAEDKSSNTNTRERGSSNANWSGRGGGSSRSSTNTEITEDSTSELSYEDLKQYATEFYSGTENRARAYTSWQILKKTYEDLNKTISNPNASSIDITNARNELQKFNDKYGITFPTLDKFIEANIDERLKAMAYKWTSHGYTDKQTSSNENRQDHPRESSGGGAPTVVVNMPGSENRNPENAGGGHWQIPAEIDPALIQTLERQGLITRVK